MAKLVFAAGTSHTPMLLAADETLPRFVETDQKMKHRDKDGRPVTYGDLLEKADPKLAHLVAPEHLVARQNVARAAGYSVTEAGSAAEALSSVQTTDRSFAVILLDITLPDCNGTDLIPQLRVTAPRSQVILTSGRAEEDVPGHGADRYLAKPFGTDELAENVSAALAERSAAVMRHHGTLVTADTLAAADVGARHLEWLCDVWLRAAAVGTPRLLSPEQVADVVVRLTDYGQRTAPRPGGPT